MQNITSAAELKQAIELLQAEEVVKRQLLKEQLSIAFESLKPINLLRKTIKDVYSSPELTDSIIGNVAGLASGYLSNKLFVGSSGNMFRKFIGAFVQLGVSRIVARYPDTIKSFGYFVIDYFLGKKETKSKDSES